MGSVQFAVGVNLYEFFQRKKMSDFKSVPTDAIDEPLNEPPPYTPTSEPNSPPEPKTGFDINYLKTVPGALKIIEMILIVGGTECEWESLYMVIRMALVLSSFICSLFHVILYFTSEMHLSLPWMVLDILGFICALVDISWAGLGAGFVQWAAMSGFIVTLIFFIFHAFNIFGRLPGFWELYEFIYLIIISVEITVAAIVCAARAAFGPSVIAACVFTAIASIMYIIDTVLAYRTWKEAREKRQKEARGGQRSSFCIIF